MRDGGKERRHVILIGLVSVLVLMNLISAVSAKWGPNLVIIENKISAVASWYLATSARKSAPRPKPRCVSRGALFLEKRHSHLIEFRATHFRNVRARTRLFDLRPHDCQGFVLRSSAVDD